jgi:hypothetical protein
MRLRSTDLSARTIGNETIVLDMRSSRYFSVIGVGSRLWELLADETTLDALVATIVEEYEVDAATASRDTAAFVERLHSADLLV